MSAQTRPLGPSFRVLRPLVRHVNIFWGIFKEWQVGKWLLLLYLQSRYVEYFQEVKEKHDGVVPDEVSLKVKEIRIYKLSGEFILHSFSTPGAVFLIEHVAHHLIGVTGIMPAGSAGRFSSYLQKWLTRSAAQVGHLISLKMQKINWFNESQVSCQWNLLLHWLILKYTGVGQGTGTDFSCEVFEAKSKVFEMDFGRQMNCQVSIC